MKENLWDIEGYKVLYTNTRGVAYTASLRVFRLKYRKDYYRYKGICNKGMHYIGVPLYSKNVICIPVKHNPEDDANRKFFFKGMKKCLKKTWDKPLVIPYIYVGYPQEVFKEKVLELNQGNNIIKFIGV